jgi:tetratricopeptide (TPR) repeat protein
MKSRLLARFASVALLLCLSHPASTSAQELSGRQLKKVAKQAEKAFDAGGYDQAIELYDQVLASTSGTDAARADALYGSAMIRLLPDAGHQDVERARQLLDELAAFPRHPRHVEIAAARALLDRLGSARADVEHSIAELETKIAAFEAERVQAQAEEASGQDAADDRVRSLESRLRKARGEVSECQADLEKKEQALQKLRDALVGGS